MTSKNELKLKLDSKLIARYALIGGSIGLVLISIFLLGVKHADPSWPKYWQIRPLVVVPLATAGGGLFIYFLTTLFANNGWSKIVAVIIGIIGFIISLWMGTVLGLDGTLWN
ncbi:MAG TPA: hypothetical protein VLA58_00685 [Chitinophagaceae bacterium]|nr:hypothetical protein [Chitinophagaceae bacterium]